MDKATSKMMSTTTQTDRLLRIGVVIPAWNEAGNIAQCLASLTTFRDCGDQIVVIDAASTDATATLAQRAGARVIRLSEHHRGYAIAAGFEAVCDAVDVVLIAHADMRFSSDARAAIASNTRCEMMHTGSVVRRPTDE